MQTDHSLLPEAQIGETEIDYGDKIDQLACQVSGVSAARSLVVERSLRQKNQYNSQFATHAPIQLVDLCPAARSHEKMDTLYGYLRNMQDC